MKSQKKTKMEHRNSLIYKQYMVGVPVLEIGKRYGDNNPSKTARKYAKKHNLPFEPREKWGHKKKGDGKK